MLALALAGCASPAARIDAFAARAGLTRELVHGTAFRHVIYVRHAANPATLNVYLEGDGLPWLHGRVPASDPTTRNPLALQLLAASHEPAIYVSRPCYQSVSDPDCAATVWTTGRYSPAVVASMSAVIQRKARDLGASRLRLIGYSGGGVLAVLIAERLENVRAVLTLGANLDLDAWTRHHGYLALSESLNPARSRASHPWPELHLHGGIDTIVPVETTRAYFERYPAARQVIVDGYEHVCCWREHWPEWLGRAP